VIPSAFGWALYPSGGARLSATVDDWRYVDGPTVTGTADLPKGSSMTVTDQQTGKSVSLKNGAFSIPTGIGMGGARTPLTAHALIPCHGGARSCRARINFAGGARQRRIVIGLSDTDLVLRSVNAVSRKKHVAYRLSGGHFTLGGSEYVVTLNAARSSPAGSHLILTFGNRTAAARGFRYDTAAAAARAHPAEGRSSLTTS
jgi:hypothetical protein